MNEQMDERFQTQSLTDHLSELRDRLLRSFFVLIVAASCSWIWSYDLLDWIRMPIANLLPQGGLVFTHPMDQFMAHVKVSLWAGFILSSPFWLYQVWMFIAPGLYRKEKKISAGFIVGGMILFSLGVSFVYWIVMPKAFHFLLTFGDGTDQPMITIRDYLSVFMTLTLVFGLAFQLPLLLLVLALMGIVNSTQLKNQRRYAIVILATLAALITPPDVLSLVFLVLPLVLLYECSIWVVRWTGR